MAQNETLRRYLEAGMAFTEMTRSRAEGIVRDLVKAGEVQREQAKDWVEELVEQSRKNTENLVSVVRREISDQLSRMGIATKDDLARLEARLGGGPATTAKAAAPAKAAGKTPAAKTTKKAAAPAKAAGARKTAAKKA